MRNLFNQELSKEEIQLNAPSVYSSGPSSKVSAKYTFIPTTTIMEDLGKGGWNVYEATQRNSRTEGGLYTKHMLRFRNEDIPMVDDIIPEIVLTNSHDGRNAFNLHAGLFRLVCSNGLVIADQTFEKVKIKHQWYSMKEIQSITDKVLTSIPTIMGCVDDFKKTILTDTVKKDFAKKAILTRWKEGQDFLPLDELLKPIRQDDRGDELWKVFNVIQEKILTGGITYQLASGRQQTVRELTNIDQRLAVNKKLWTLAEDYV
jgi:hypothetical protein